MFEEHIDNAYIVIQEGTSEISKFMFSFPPKTAILINRRLV